MDITSTRIEQSQFAIVLRDRLNTFFSDQKISRKGDSMMAFKIIIGLSAWLGSYIALYAFNPSNWQFLFIYILHGLTHVFLLLNITHDSNHGAISRQTLVNKSLSYIMDICGINSYMWRIIHHRGHHSYINVHEEDEAILGRRLFRFSPHTRRRWIHKYQHFYAIPLYGLFSLDYVLLKDFEYFFSPSYRPLKRIKHPAKEYAILFAGKFLYLTYMILLPIVVLGRSLLFVVISFILTHFFIGLITLVVFQTTHVIETSQFPKDKTDFENYVYHIFATTADYATRSSTTTWLVGGLNQHVVHHLCPNVCHTHYQQLTRIVRETAKQYQVPYREHKTIRQALTQHFALLKRLGNEL